MQGRVPDDGGDDGLFQARRIALRHGLPPGAALSQVGLAGGGIGVVQGAGAQGLVGFRELVGEERQGVGVQAGLQGTAGAGRGDGLQHGLHGMAAAPLVDLHGEGGVHHGVVHQQRVDGRAVEHDAGHAGPPVGEGAGEVVLGLAHGPGVHQRDALGEVDRLGVLLAEGGELVHERHGFQRQLAQAHHGVHGGERMEGRLGELLHVGVQPLGELP